MSYWVVMGIVVLALIAVLIAVAVDDEDETSPETAEPIRPIWVALGTSARSPHITTEENSTVESWATLVERRLADRVIAFDFTEFGVTAGQVQHEALASTVAARPDLVSFFIGPDDFRDAERIDVFERRVWHILSTLSKTGANLFVATLPPLQYLPALAAEDDAAAIGEELAAWNATISRLGHAVGATLIEVADHPVPFDPDWQGDRAGRYVLTEPGQRWFAERMSHAIEASLADSSAGAILRPTDESAQTR